MKYATFLGIAVSMALQAGGQTPESKPASKPADNLVFSFRYEASNPAMGVSVLDLVKEWSRMLGSRLVVSGDVADRLERMPAKLTGTMTVPMAEANDFFESIFADHGVFLLPVGAPSLGLQRVCVEYVGNPEAIARLAPVVDANDLERYAKRAASVVTAVLGVRSADPERVCEKLAWGGAAGRLNSWERLVPLGHHSILVTSTGPKAARLAKLVAEADRTEGLARVEREAHLRKTIDDLEARVRALEEKAPASKPTGK